MKNLNSQYFKEKMKSYYGGVAVTALMCTSSVVQAMNSEDDIITNRPRLGVALVQEESRHDEYRLRLMLEHPSIENLKKIKPGELGLFCEDDRLYCKAHNKEKMQIFKSDNPTVGLHSEIFDRVLHTLQDRMSPVYLQAGLAQEEERHHKAAFIIYNETFEKITLEDEKALYTLLRCYTQHDLANHNHHLAFRDQANEDFCRRSINRTPAQENVPIVENVPNIITFFSEKFSQCCTRFTQATLERAPTTAAQLRKTFQDMRAPLQEQLTNSEYVEGNVEKFRKVLNELFPELDSKLLFELTKTEKTCGAFLENIKILSTNPQKAVGSGPTFTLKGAIIGTSDLFEIRPSAKVENSPIDPNNDKITNLSRFSVALAQEEGQHDLANYNYTLALGDQVDGDVCRKTIKARQKFSEINIYSKHILLIDQDLEEPGVNVSLLAPYWFVVGPRKISLKGSGGLNHKLETAKHAQHGKGEAGEDGLPGLPGESGGHFYGRGGKFYKLDALIIDVGGGQGGKGQNGGNGGNGAPAEVMGNQDDVNDRRFEPEKREVILFDEVAYKNVHERNAKWVFTLGNEKFREVYKSGKMGKQGGDAGRGGKRGRPGQKGSARIEDMKTGHENKSYSLVSHRTKGIDGNPGSPGKVGDYRIYQRTYINEKILPSMQPSVKILDENNQTIHKGVTAGEAAGGLLLGGGTGGATVMLAVEGAITMAIAAPVALGVTIGAAVATVTLGGIKVLGSLVSAAIHSEWEEGLIELNPDNGPYSGDVPDDLNETNIIVRKSSKPKIVREEKINSYNNLMMGI